MNQVGLIITINKFKNYFESKQKTWSCESIENAKSTLVEYLVEQFKNLNIDYPSELIDFEYIWFDRQYVNANAFNYQIFIDGNWCEPWEAHDIYFDVLDKMLEQECANPPNFDELYGEPDPDETEVEKYDFDKKLEDILKNAQTLDLHEEEVKECRCNTCLEQEKLR
jgi:hypothetical protein